MLIIGGPRSGKSTLASRLKLPHYCTDPKSLVKEPLSSVSYLPEGFEWGKDSEWVISNWFSNPGNWVIEGVGVVRALRKWGQPYPPCDKIIVLKDPFPGNELLPGQASMHKAVKTIWDSVSDKYKSITEYL